MKDKPYKDERCRHLVHACFYCTEKVKKMNMHYRRVHKDEERVAKILEIKDRAEKLFQWRKLTNDGDHLHNDRVMRGGGGKLFSMRKPKIREKNTKYVTCKTCHGRLVGINLKEHQKVCFSREESEESEVDIKNIDEFYEDVIERMNKKVSNFILENQIVYKFTRNLWEEKGYNLIDVVRSKVRDLYNLWLELHKIDPEKKFIEFFKLLYADSSVAVLKKTSGFSKVNRSVYIKFPSKITRYCRAIVDFVKFLKVYYIKSQQKEESRKVDDFLTIFNYETNKKLKKFVRIQETERKVKKPSFIRELNECVNIVNRHLQKEIDELTENLHRYKNYVCWAKLASNLLMRLTIFNRRRGGACEKLLLSQYQNTKSIADEAVEEGLYVMDEVDMKFLNSIKVVEIVHKKNRVVPIYITREIQERINILVKYRKSAKVNEKNPYVFARGQSSLNPLRGLDVFKKYKKYLPEELRSLFCATNLRKHGATVLQYISLNKSDRDDLTQHLGHSAGIHDRFYKIRDKPTAALNMGKMLTILNSGNIKPYVGKTLKEVSIDESLNIAPKKRNRVLDSDLDIEPDAPQKKPNSPNVAPKRRRIRVIESDSDSEPDPPKKKPNSLNVAPKRKRIRVIESDSDSDSEPDAPKKKPNSPDIAPERRRTRVIESDSDSESDAPQCGPNFQRKPYFTRKRS